MIVIDTENRGEGMLDNSVVEQLVERAERINDLELNRLLKMFLEERSQLLSERKNLEDLANKDPLTGLENRRGLSEVQDCTSLAIIDIDNFKTVNDTYGHNEGDRVIKGVASIIRKNVRDSDFVCRYGGDEFVIAFTNCFQEDVVRKRLERIQEQISNQLVLGNSFTPVTISVGVVMNIQNQVFDDIKGLITKADQALYRSKEHGKSRITEYEDSFRTGVQL